MKGAKVSVHCVRLVSPAPLVTDIVETQPAW